MTFTGSDGRTENAFSGTRTIGDGQYVLYFDASRSVFVLDRLDSTFHMNLTRTPGNSDPGSLAKKYPHIDGKPSSGAAAKGSSSKAAGSKTKASDGKASAAARKDPPAARKQQQQKKPAKSVNLALPQESKAKPPPPTSSKPSQPKGKSRPADEEEEEEDEEDDLLLVEYPGGNPSKSANRDFSPAFPSVRRFDDFMDQRESEADDADGESADEPDTDFKLPSPVNHAQQSDGEEEEASDEDDEQLYRGREPEPEPMAVDNGAGDASPNLEDDLEKDLEEAFAVENSQTGTPAGGDGDESEISEED